MKTRCIMIALFASVIMLCFCVVAEAGQSATRTLRLSVTIPPTFRTQASQARQNTNLENGRTTFEQEIRNDQIVMIQTITQN